MAVKTNTTRMNNQNSSIIDTFYEATDQKAPIFS
jgi:hypothetical protein